MPKCEKYFTYHVCTKLWWVIVYLYRVFFLVWQVAGVISGAITLAVGKVNKLWLLVVNKRSLIRGRHSLNIKNISRTLETLSDWLQPRICYRWPRRRGSKRRAINNLGYKQSRFQMRNILLTPEFSESKIKTKKYRNQLKTGETTNFGRVWNSFFITPRPKVHDEKSYTQHGREVKNNASLVM